MTQLDSLPDIYADGVQVSVGNYGVTLTLLLSDPERPDELGEPRARVRLSPELAQAVTKILVDALAKMPQLGSGPEATE